MGDALRLLGHLPEQQLGDRATNAVGILTLASGQDVEPASDSDGRDGCWRITGGTAPDGMVSTVAPEGRHVHKTAATSRDRAITARLVRDGRASHQAHPLPETRNCAAVSGTQNLILQASLHSVADALRFETHLATTHPSLDIAERVNTPRHEKTKPPPSFPAAPAPRLPFTGCR
ncbi:hypothetical protein K9S39_09440 [Streptomyces halobius]|uniref:Uncharacterized protein n=1 Tax=Streptomyces halobius TaxID=2879846 RepID=A0ABY4M6N2_9ACTN|nr:hypothetical protein [Streptomyces halobius]UQA92041.1 hypothetical protein K9S39_09440 [Streptomyces halobius]